ncbi:MAG: VOC family protein [Anaerolineales bacterium]|nr:VOC family protein [Anaerolineales bacterium]
MKLSLTHIRLLVWDVPACTSFYRDTLGLPLRFADEEGNYASFKTGDVTLALFRRQAMQEVLGENTHSEDTPDRERAALVFAVDHVDRTVEELRRNGVAFLSEPRDRPAWGIRTAHFRDPEGNMIEINTPLPA